MSDPQTTAGWQVEAGFIRKTYPHKVAQRKARSDELKRLRAFVQWVADHSNDPAVVREAKAHGAKP